MWYINIPKRNTGHLGHAHKGGRQKLICYRGINYCNYRIMIKKERKDREKKEDKFGQGRERKKEGNSTKEKKNK